MKYHNDDQRTSHRKLQHFRKARARARVTGLQAGGQSVVERGICGLNLRRAEGRKRACSLPIPGAVAVAMLPIATEAYAVRPLGPIDIVGELVGARVDR